MTGVLPEGFASVELEGTRVLVSSGPRDDAAGIFPDEDCPDVLWTRQVLMSGRLTAVVLAPSVFSRGPEGFADVHELAERIAVSLGIGAIEIGVVAIGAAEAYLANVDEVGYSVAATVAVEHEATAVVLTTDAQLSAGALADVLASLPAEAPKVRLMLASGASPATPDVVDVTRSAATAYAHAVAVQGAAS